MKGVASALVLSAMLFATPARAEPAARFVYLRGASTETCPDEVDVRQAVHARLGYDPFSSYATSTLLAEVHRSGTGFAAELKLVDGDNLVRGERSLKTAGACADLMNALALSISIAIDPLSITRDGPPPGTPPSERAVERLPSTSPAEESTTTTTPPPESDRPRVDAPPPSHDFAIALGPVASIGAAPAPAVGLALGLEAASKHTLVGIEGRADLPASRSNQPGRIQSSLLSGSLLAGLRFGVVHAAAVGMVGRIAASAEDVDAPRRASAVVGGAGLRVGVAVPLGRALGLEGERWSLEARARAEALGMFVRHTLAVDGHDGYAYPPVSGSAAVALALRFH